MRECVSVSKFTCFVFPHSRTHTGHWQDARVLTHVLVRGLCVCVLLCIPSIPPCTTSTSICADVCVNVHIYIYKCVCECVNLYKHARTPTPTGRKRSSSGPRTPLSHSTRPTNSTIATPSMDETPTVTKVCVCVLCVCGALPYTV
jgi:hypothetical protein